MDALLTAAASPRDEATRLEMNASCARARAQLRTNCR
jgi:hypothetical protein